MARKLGKRQENLLAKIAAQLGKDVTEIQEVAAPLYTDEARVLQGQAIYNFFTARVRPEKRLKETDAQFEARYKEWNFKICETCQGEFAYSYTYDGVKFCSLECVDIALKKIGLQVTRGRSPKKRYGLMHPAIIPAPVLEELRSAYPDSLGTSDVPFHSVLPTLQKEEQPSREDQMSE